MKYFATYLITGLLLFGVMGQAQVTTATFYGTLTDPSGAAIPSAIVSVVHQGTGATITKTAEYGDELAGNVNLIAKSGTNQWHGSLFENFQAENLNARLQNLPAKPSLNFNQFGGSIGGPIVRDRVFIFGASESYSERTFQNVQGDFPTQRLRDGAIAAVPAYKTILDTAPAA
jgi:hypothetical protein